MTPESDITIEVATVHPSVTRVNNGQQKIELPTSWFTDRPQTGQTWKLSLQRMLHEQEKIQQLNQYLRRQE